MKTVLLTLGRLPKALAIARACRAARCRVLIADPFRWHLCKPSRDVHKSFRVTAPNDSVDRYLQDLLAIVEEESVDFVIPISEEALHVAKLADRLPAGVGLWAAELPQLAELHHKRDFIALAARRGLAVPDTFTANESAAKELAQRGNYVEKPVHSCSGIGLRFAKAGEPLQATTEDGLVQEHLDGDLISSLSVVSHGREVASVFYRGRVFAGTVAICFERVDDAGSAKDWVSDFITGSDYNGFLAFDFIVDDGGQARAIECNPRATSGVHFFDMASLGQALLDPDAAATIELSRETRYQWAYSTLTETYAALFRPKEFARRFKEMRRARDVIWAARDPLPFLLMTPMSWEILWPAMTSSLSLGEATQRDIAWFGDRS
ncbi:ATP-grasp domain-containing protein [Congregibacter variabilis]|uniref:ATP-grasp domain-containing protein n=1 Tax=Congregibacter variabilis TaxID=3081200 RepID=A0ABZ0HXC4_9GAMM|nr:ATP-grasp domain-containing protein [Congregibacter sp. IMCC43200]